MGVILPEDEAMITKRVIHTSADFEYTKTLTFSKDAVAIAKELIVNGADIVTDTNMAFSGINKKALSRFPGGFLSRGLLRKEALLLLYSYAPAHFSVSVPSPARG